MKRAALLCVLALAAGCQVHYGPGDRPFEKAVEFPELALPPHGAWTVTAVPAGDRLVVERAAPSGEGPLWEEERLRRAAGVPRWKPLGGGRYEVRLFGVRLPLVSDRRSQKSGDAAAKAFLASFVKGRRVALVPSPSYGAANVYVLATRLEEGAVMKTSTHVNRELLLRGLAQVDRASFRQEAAKWRLSVMHRQFRRAEEQAREQGRGLWRFGP